MFGGPDILGTEMAYQKGMISDVSTGKLLNTQTSSNRGFQRLPGVSLELSFGNSEISFHDESIYKT